MGAVPAPLPAPRSPRYLSLDLWRGVACLLVVLHHATLYAPTYQQADRGAAVGPGVAARLVGATTWLWVGVPLFFVISGYCISATADSTRRRPHALATYFARRFRRIYPPYWILLCLLCLLVLASQRLVPGLLVDDFAGVPPPGRLSQAQWLGNLTLTESWREHVGGGPRGYLNAMAWTLCYEEQFYAVIGVLLVLAPRRFFPGAAVVTALTLAAYFFVPNQLALVGWFFDGYWLHFAAGILVYYRINYATGWRAAAANLLLLAGLAGFVALAWSRGDGSTLWHPHCSVPEGGVVAFAFALALSLLHPWDRRLTEARAAVPLLFCGRICYSLYLVHWPVVKAVGHGLYLLGVRGDAATLLVSVPVIVAASVFLSWVFFRLCESRFLNAPSSARAAKPAPAAAPAPTAALTPATAPGRSPG